MQRFKMMIAKGLTESLFTELCAISPIQRVRRFGDRGAGPIRRIRRGVWRARGCERNRRQ